MDSFLECRVCEEEFDMDQRRPKSLPCGHTVCLQCLQRLPGRLCAECREEINADLAALRDNVELVRMMDQQQWPARVTPIVQPPTLWCSDCDAAASAECKEEHSLLKANAALRHRVEDAVRLADTQGLGPDLEEGLRGCGDEQALAALKLLRGGAAGCSLTLAVDNEATVFEAHWQPTSHGEPHPLFKVMVAVLAVGCGLRERGNEEPRQDHAQAEPIPEVDLVDEMDPSDDDGQTKRTALMQRVIERRVRTLGGVNCNKDPYWVVQLLREASPTLEELEVFCPRQDHLDVVLRMPRLQRLKMPSSDICTLPQTLRRARPRDRRQRGGDSRPEAAISNRTTTNQTFSLPPALPEGHLAGRLHFLHVHVPIMPRDAVVALLRTHASSLRTLELCVGTSGIRVWPWSCGDLHDVLGPCGLGALTRLLLVRGVGYSHDTAECTDQRDAVRRVLPPSAVDVILCNVCDEVEPEPF